MLPYIIPVGVGMSDARQHAWKGCALTQDMDQDKEVTGSHGCDVGVMWASSQGGCGPLNRLLRNAEGEFAGLLFSVSHV